MRSARFGSRVFPGWLRARSAAGVFRQWRAMVVERQYYAREGDTMNTSDLLEQLLRAGSNRQLQPEIIPSRR